jgi:hypothetical protein
MIVPIPAMILAKILKPISIEISPAFASSAPKTKIPKQLTRKIRHKFKISFLCLDKKFGINYYLRYS